MLDKILDSPYHAGIEATLVGLLGERVAEAVFSRVVLGRFAAG